MMIAFFKDEIKRTLLLLIVSGISVALSLFGVNFFSINPAWVAILLCGFPILKGALIGLFTSFDIKADVLVSIALIAAILIGEIFAAGEIAFIMAIGGFLEEFTVAKSRAGIENLIHLTPQQGRIIKNKEEKIVSAQDIKIDDILRVLPGETIAVDGMILSGSTSIDQGVLTGESLPVDKTLGDEVFSGTVNQFGTFDMKATKTGEDSSLQRMISLVQSADANKAKIVGIADRWATWIVVIALISASFTWWISGEMIRAVTILVVFCPCALVLATPTAIVAGIGNATKYGILVKEGDALERLSQVSTLCFDKTGTLTYGVPQVTAIKCFTENYTEKEMILLLAAGESRSEHPLGKAITAYAEKTYSTPFANPEHFEVLPGEGIIADIQGKRFYTGNLKLMNDNNMTPLPKEHLVWIEKQQQKGFTLIFMGSEQTILFAVALGDTLRKETPDTICAFEKMNIETILLTGDSKEAANHIATLAGIKRIISQCKPLDKYETIKNYETKEEKVCMIGDGINDALALKEAHVGIAMGGIGSDIAVEAADIALIHDDIKHLPHLFSLAKRMMTVIRINLIFSLGLNFIAILLAMSGVLTPVWGALVHNAGSVLVIINAAFLLKWKNHRQ